jgi:hypothetical protein
MTAGMHTSCARDRVNGGSVALMWCAWVLTHSRRLAGRMRPCDFRTITANHALARLLLNPLRYYQLFNP